MGILMELVFTQLSSKDVFRYFCWLMGILNCHSKGTF